MISIRKIELPVPGIELYESLGFVPIASPDATHILLFDQTIVPT